MNNLRAAREATKLTQQAVADVLCVDRVTVARYESGERSPNDAKWIELANLYKTSVDYLMGNDVEQKDALAVRIPVLGTVAAGIPIDAIEEVVDWEEIPDIMAKTGEFFGLRIKGRSMEPRIMDGDTVIVRRQPDVNSGEVAIVIVNGYEGTCKKVKKHDNGGVTLIALNTAVYEPHYYTPKEIHDLPVTIVGKVVELRGKF